MYRMLVVCLRDNSCLNVFIGLVAVSREYPVWCLNGVRTFPNVTSHYSTLGRVGADAYRCKAE